MAYVITEPCIGTKAKDCVTVCPVDCIHPREDEPGHEEAPQLYIDPDTCINCGACAAVCPTEAIYPEEEVPDKWKQYIQINADYYKK